MNRLSQGLVRLVRLAGPVRLAGLVGRGVRVGVIVFCYGTVIVGSASLAKVRGGREGRGFADGERWARMLTRLGPSYIKIGQLLSTRRDLLPESMTGPLARLTDACRPPARRRIEKAVRDAYDGRPWPFKEFNWQPVACGSIATVHEALTQNGDKVAVKVRRPGIETVMRRDFRLTAAAMALMGALPRLRRMPFKVMHEQVGLAILRQLDFAAEAASLAALRENLAALPNVRIPAPYVELCTSETIVMEFMEGLRRFTPGDLDMEDRRGVVRSVLEAIYEMLFIDGLVHCDLHPGNLYIERGTELVMLDAGFVIQLPDAVRRSFADFFLNMALGEGWMCGQIVVDCAAHVAPDCDVEGFRTALAALVAESSGVRSGDFDLARFAGRLFELQRGFGVFPAPEFAFPLLSLLVIEGMIKGFDADMDFQAGAVPVLARRNVPRGAVSSV